MQFSADVIFLFLYLNENCLPKSASNMKHVGLEVDVW